MVKFAIAFYVISIACMVSINIGLVKAGVEAQQLSYQELGLTSFN